MRPNRKLIPVILILLLLAVVSIAVSGSGVEAFAVRRIGNIHPYADNSFQVTAPESGTLEIRIHDNICVYRVLRQRIDAGETVIHWDGCGYNREKLYEKTYTVSAELTGGRHYSDQIVASYHLVGTFRPQLFSAPDQDEWKTHLVGENL